MRKILTTILLAAAALSLAQGLPAVAQEAADPERAAASAAARAELVEEAIYTLTALVFKCFSVLVLLTQTLKHQNTQTHKDPTHVSVPMTS